MDTFPLEGDPIPEGFSGWLIFFDEITSALPALQAAAYKILLDRMIGQTKLHPKCLQMAAGNLTTDGAVAEEMSTALQSRLVHYELTADLNEWLLWAAQNGVSDKVTTYLTQFPDKFYVFKADHVDNTYPAPRTWKFVSDLLKYIDVADVDAAVMISGAISPGYAHEFLTYCKVYLEMPTVEEIIKDPLTTIVSSDPSMLYAVTGTIAAKITVDNIDQVIQYIGRLASEFQIICIKQSLLRNKAILNTPALSGWLAANAHLMT